MERKVVLWLAGAALIVGAGPRPVRGDNPSELYVYDMTFGSWHDRIAMSTLMGNVSKTSPEMFMAYQNSTALSNPRFWLDRYVETQPQTLVHWETSPSWFVNRYRNQLSGYVLYDDAGTHVNEATSLAGVLNAMAVSVSKQSLATLAGLPMLADVRGRDTAWVQANYGQLFNRNKLFSLDTFHGHELRDFAVLHGGLMYWDPPQKQTLLSQQNPHTQVYGWDTSESEFFGSASTNNLKAVAANYSQGLSALSQWSVDVPEQATHVSPPMATEDNVHYVAFVMSDGDNAQWLTNGFANDPRWFGSPVRGNFTMNWDITPEIADLSPITLKYLYDNASQGQTKDFFVTAHGPGTDYPSEVPDYAGSLAATSAAMQRVDQNILSILDNSWDTSVFDTILDDPNVDGAMFKSNWGCGYACRAGQIYWHNGKPVVSVKHSLWDGIGTPDSIAAALNTAPQEPRHNQGSYSIVNVHPWSTGGLGDPMGNLNQLVGSLNSAVEIVTLEELMFHLRQNFGNPPDQGGPVNLVRNGNFENGSVDWFTSGNHFEMLYPEDATGGQQSAGFDTQVAADIGDPSTWADWRALHFDVQPGETLQWSFRYKTTPGTLGEVLAELRTFADDTFAMFTGEDKIVLQPTQDAWQTVSRTYVVPPDATIVDLRFNNIFTDILQPFVGGFRLDDIVVYRPDLISPDFNLDGYVDGADIDALVAEIAAEGHLFSFDLTGDGLVDAADLDRWLAEAGAVNLPSGLPYVHGDANLDGVVDTSDFNIWNAHKFTSIPAWTNGDFTADGFVDASDFNVWNSFKFTSSDVDAVPEPYSAICLAPGLLIGIWMLRSMHQPLRCSPPNGVGDR